MLLYFLGQVDFSGIGTQSLFAIPIPFKYGFAFDFAAFLPIAFIYLITAIESTGDLTATQGNLYLHQTYQRRSFRKFLYPIQEKQSINRFAFVNFLTR